jgi:hypothetical protein
MRAGVVLVLALSIAAFCAPALASGDHGSSTPPANLSDSNKTIWMTEWVACHHTKLGQLSKSVGVKIPAGRPPQVAAKLIAQKAESLLYDMPAQVTVAVDGCQNGILWRYYHGQYISS